jgi:hypothetical protein
MPSEQRIMDLLILVFFFLVFQESYCFHFFEKLLGVASTSFFLFFTILHESKQ